MKTPLLSKVLIGAFFFLFFHALYITFWKLPVTFTLWQIPTANTRQMMGYVIKDADGRLYVVDGGQKVDAPFLHKFLMEYGGEVDGWFISHPHDDHTGALTELLENPQGLTIKAIYGAFLEDSIMARCDKRRAGDFRMLSKELDRSGVEFIRTEPGMVIKTDRLTVEVLTDISPEIKHNCMNESSIVYKFSDFKKSVLFLGDLGVVGGQKLLKGPYKEKLKSDYVQMAHHGQRGVNFNVYKAIAPQGCLWPTPEWLWNNDGGKGYNTGPWDTIRVRRWMDKLGVEEHYVMYEGLQEIR